MALMTDLCTVFDAVMVLPVVSGATFVIVVSVAVVSSSLLSPIMVYILWFWVVYPI